MRSSLSNMAVASAVLFAFFPALGIAEACACPAFGDLWDHDIDGDGVPDSLDDDMDGDGIPNGSDFDLDGDGTPDRFDLDIDGDGVPNVLDIDTNGDSVPNELEDQTNPWWDDPSTIYIPGGPRNPPFKIRFSADGIDIWISR
ncbi:MAG: thrombospondin type 3 repeat-containing protein [Planctomycetaceae bacterium]|nr:thrombospondin type 3 repeat-containing protein [Planctomycetaceae bacterium]